MDGGSPGGLLGESRRVDAAGGQGVLAGDFGVQVNSFYGMAGPAGGVAGSGLTYREQVRRIAPPALAGREPELAELAEFCTAPDGGAYAWWQAGPWAGKSALLSTFVLEPSAEVLAAGVRLVSFFVTARLAGQDTREAFTEAVLGQLVGLTGQDLPPALPQAAGEPWLAELLGRAAESCAAAGGRLVLVVDGLDEDRGVTTGPDARSIAGLLPGVLPARMRVIVAGRYNPPVPDDVPDWHPLRDPAIIHRLAPSPPARDTGRLGRQELRRLLHGSEAERDVLGVLTAARGGLTAEDLRELTGVALWEVEDILHGAAGRTFTRRAAARASGVGLESYLLGHEELQAAAERYLADRLEGYRDRLHRWAQGYLGREWPTETPEYLLGGYFRLLAATGDLPRAAALASDPGRHDRMLEHTGADAAALAEARAALDLIAASEVRDLASALALAFCRDHLVSWVLDASHK